MTYYEAEQFILGLNNLRDSNISDQHKSSRNLKRVQFLLDILKNPEKKIPHYIHVTGTSGKGSVCTFLHSILCASGKATGLLISPHQTKMTERWKIGKMNMSDSEFIALVKELRQALQIYIRTSPYEMLSFLDITTVIGFLYFAKHKVDWAIIEIGCGGRFDSTNIIPWKDAAVITNVGLDHTDILGKTKEEIAKNKSGIIQKQCKVFTMESDPKIVSIIKKECTKKKAKLHVIGDEYTILENNLCGTIFEYKQKQYTLPILGEHQIKNAVLCIEMAQILGFSLGQIAKGLQQVKQPLRMELILQKPLLILDGAHNEDKIKTTVQTLLAILPHMRPTPNIHVIACFPPKKNWGAMIQALSQLHPKTIACTRDNLHAFRKVAHPKSVLSVFQKYIKSSLVKVFIDPEEAYLWSKKQAKTSDIILATGSIYSSGELRKLLKQD